jgi:hypothetical protein
MFIDGVPVNKDARDDAERPERASATFGAVEVEAYETGGGGGYDVIGAGYEGGGGATTAAVVLARDRN